MRLYVALRACTSPYAPIWRTTRAYVLHTLLHALCGGGHFPPVLADAPMHHYRRRLHLLYPPVHSHLEERMQQGG